MRVIAEVVPSNEPDRGQSTATIQSFLHRDDKIKKPSNEVCRSGR
jgi:hypothetical protein